MNLPLELLVIQLKGIARQDNPQITQWFISVKLSPIISNVFSCYFTEESLRYRKLPRQEI